MVKMVESKRSGKNGILAHFHVFRKLWWNQSYRKFLYEHTFLGFIYSIIVVFASNEWVIICRSFQYIVLLSISLSNINTYKQIRSKRISNIWRSCVTYLHLHPTPHHTSSWLYSKWWKWYLYHSLQNWTKMDVIVTVINELTNKHWNHKQWKYLIDWKYVLSIILCIALH